MGPLSTLLKIQDLEIVLKESSIVHSDNDLETDNESEAIQSQIDELKNQIPERIVKHYEKVQPAKHAAEVVQDMQTMK